MRALLFTVAAALALGASWVGAARKVRSEKQDSTASAQADARAVRAELGNEPHAPPPPPERVTARQAFTPRQPIVDPGAVNVTAQAIGKFSEDIPGIGLALQIVNLPGKLASMFSGMKVPDLVTGGAIALVGGAQAIAEGVSAIFTTGLGNSSSGYGGLTVKEQIDRGIADGSKSIENAAGDYVKVGGHAGRASRASVEGDAP